MPLQAFCQPTVHDAACDKAQTTAAMRQCEIARLKRADEGMNAAYKRLSARLDENAQAKLRAAQRAWLKYRDAEAAYQADAVRGGTLAPLIMESVQADLTEARRVELEEAISGRSRCGGAGGCSSLRSR
jgi:uncharacterized protein YecT (DUF1311 family)